MGWRRILILLSFLRAADPPPLNRVIPAAIFVGLLM